MKQLFTLFLAFAVTCVMAQDSKVTSGMVNYDGGQYKEALNNFNEALGAPDLLKPKNATKGYFYRAKTRIALMREEAKAGTVSDQFAILNAYEDLNKALKRDDGKLRQKILAEKKLINPMLLQAGLMLLNSSYSAQGSGDYINTLYLTITRYMEASIEIDPYNYLPYDMLGQTFLGMKDTVQAYKNFTKGITTFEKNVHKRPDLMCAYMYYRKALIERYQTGDLNAALATVQGGKLVVKGEWDKLKANKDSYDATTWGQLKQQYDYAMEDLGKFELDIYLNYPDKLQEALQAFEASVAKEPNNYTIHVAYAQLLEKTDADKAEVMYKKAIAIDDTKLLALFNLGALYVNRGVALYQMANETDDFNKADALQKEGNGWFKKAYEPLQKAQAIEPCDAIVLKTLMQITMNLELMDDFKKYKALKTECGL